MQQLGGTAQAVQADGGGALRPAHAGPAAGLIALALLLVALAGSVGLSGGAWLTGAVCGLSVNAALALGIARHGTDRLGLADWVTLTRATLAAGVAAIVADSLRHPAPVALLTALTVIALSLDAVDGWIVRRTATGTPLGARFDGEVDAFLILALSVYAARLDGPWVLAIGAARYAFLVAGWLLPWMRAELPFRHWRKVVAATQGIVLAFAAGDVFPRIVTRGALVVALALLAESFGRDVWWLWRRRHAGRERAATAAGQRSAGRARTRRAIAVALTVLALAVVWAALVAPDQLNRLTPGAFARLPLEGLVLVALALVLPTRARRALACLAGPVLGVLVILKVLDMGFFEAFDRPFDPVADGSYTGIGIETLRDSIGRTDANLAVAGAALLALGVLVGTTLALLRLTRVAAANRHWSIPAIGVLTAVWAVCWLAGAQLVSYAPIASTSAAGMVSHELRAVRAGVQDHAVFADEIGRDRFRSTPAGKLLTGLRGKDVILAFVESYGKVAVQGSSFSPQVDTVLAKGDRQLKAAGFSSRSGFLTSSTFGGLSWLAHSTLQSGVWVDDQLRYDQLVKTRRLTLSDAFKRAGWRTVGDVPSNNRAWPEGSTYYHYDKLYDRRDVGYRGPKFSYASMPDQYVFAALQRLELAKPHRKPLFAEVDLVSSHTPWTRIPKMIPWSAVGDGSIYRHMPVDDLTRAQLFNDSGGVHAAYGQSIEYTMSALVSFVQHYGDKNLVLVVLGDHQPAKVITGESPSHDVPISIIAHDPAVLDRISGWGWNAGLRPDPKAPVWRMDAFRDRFLSAFGP